MKQSFGAVVLTAMLVAVSTNVGAQTVNRQQGTTTNYGAIESEVLGSQMTGMRVSSKFENCSTNGCSTNTLNEASGLWKNFGNGTSGVDLMFNNVLYGTVRIASNANTFNSNYTFDWFASNDFRTLKFEGGVGFGDVIFDIETGDRCGAPSISCAGQTTNSSTGNAFDIESSFDYNNGVTYSNVVTYNNESIKFDTYTSVEMLFDNSASGPDNDQTPFTFKMDTDLGSPTSTVPEPSTYVLMASGLAALAAVSKRRRKGRQAA